MSDVTIVKFLKSWRGYGVGETAGFPAERATDLTEAGVAELAPKKGKKSNGTKTTTTTTTKSTATGGGEGGGDGGGGDEDKNKDTATDPDPDDEKP